MVGDHSRVGRDMIAVVEIIACRLMRDALTRQGCQFVTTNVWKKQGPSGPTGSHLEEVKKTRLGR